MSFTFSSIGSSGAPSQPPFGAPANAPQSASTNVFGTPGTSSPFAPTANATSNPPTSVFGGGLTTGGSLFGGASNTGGMQQAPLFSSNPGSGTSTPSLGTSTGNAPSIFGQKPTPSASIFNNTNNTPSSAPSFSFTPQKDANGALNPENKTGGTAQSGGLFANLNKPSSSVFSPTAPLGSTTPAPTKPFSFNSTTPAGPPPTDSTQGPKAPPVSNLFPGAIKPSGISFTPSSGSGSAAPGPFASNSASASNLFSNTPGSTQSAPNVATPTPAAGQAASQPVFGNVASSTTGMPASQASSQSIPPTASAGLFGNLNKPNLQSSTAATPSMFPGASSSIPSVVPTTSATAPGAASQLFTNPATAPPSTSANTTVPGTSAPAPAPLFGAQPTIPSTQPPSTTTTVPPAGSSTQAPNNLTQPTSQTLGASTTGPAPQMSRLKNKTMDEIITRWASDLLKYQKEFQDQATKVAAWDRLLVENGDKIQKLYSRTFDAEKASTEVERQLAAVEGQQAELASWLDRYESDIDEMFAKQVGHGETLQGPDQERERTYKLAEKLTDRLDEMGKNITSMIDEINEASSYLSKNSKTDDPLSHIVRVLNSHLTQLQWIDQNAELLQQKVTAAQKLGQSIGTNGYGGQDNDTMDSFFRSYRG